MNLSAQTFQSDSLQSVPFSLRSEFYQGFDTIPLTNTTTNSSNSCDEMKFFQKSLFKAEQNNSSLSWFGLPNNNDDKNEITKNHAALPIVSNSGYKGIACCECGCHFFQIEHYVAHLEATGHKKRSPNSKDGQGSPTSPIIPMLPIESYSYLHPPPGLTVGSPTLTRQQPVFKPTQTPPHTPHRIQGAPKKYQKPKFTLFFGAATKTDSLVGGCGWWIRDSCNTVVTHGSVPVQQPYSSLPRLEYEALLNGLIAAHVKKIRCLCIKSHCELSFLMMQGREVPGLSSVLYSVRDISTAIAKLLPQFQTLEVELINAEQNHYSQKLAKTVIDDFLRRQEKMALDKMIQLQAATETVSKHFLVEKKPTQPTQPIQPVSSLVGQSSPFVMLSPGDSRICIPVFTW